MGAYTKQLSDARADIGIRNVAGACINSPEFADLINRVTRRLIKRGAWFGTEVVMKMCLYGCHVVWPRYVAAVYGARFCCFGQVEIKNNWYSILGPWTRGLNWWRSDVEMVDDGETPVFNDITGNAGNFLRYYTKYTNDTGKLITFYGKKYGGETLQMLDANGNWINGLSIAAAAPFAQTTTLVTEITQVVREATQGTSRLYAYDSVNNVLRLLASYEPNEINPSYRRSKVKGLDRIPYTTGDNGEKIWKLEALVKLEYIPATQDRDFLIIDDFDALAFGIQALKLAEAQDMENSEKFWIKAISELNFESRNREPGEQFVTQSNVLGSRRVLTNPI